MGTILNWYLKTGVSLYLEGWMMLTIINLTKIFTRRENVEVVYFLHLQDHLIEALGGVCSGNLKVCTFNCCNIFYKVIELGKIWCSYQVSKLYLTTDAICQHFGHCIEKSRKLSCCLTQISGVCVYITFLN